MTSNSKKAPSIEVTFDLIDYPNTSRLINELHKIGYDQNSVEIKLPKVKFKGQFAGSLQDLIDTMSKVLSLIKNK
jgi:hypothetical protein